MLFNNKLQQFFLLSLILFLDTASSQPITPAKTLCLPIERIQFSCRIGSKIVSLCAGGEVGKTTSLTYRYGKLNKVEHEFTAEPAGKNRFYATVMPANPRALVKQVWFNQGAIRYLLTECVGGNCPQAGGLGVLRGERVLMNGQCKYEMESDLGWFSREMISFNLDSETSNVQSHTDLLIVVTADFEFEKLFP